MNVPVETCHYCCSTLFKFGAKKAMCDGADACLTVHEKVAVSDSWVPVDTKESRTGGGPLDELERILDRAELDPADRYRARRIIEEVSE